MEPIKSQDASRAVRNLHPDLRTKLTARITTGDVAFDGGKRSTIGGRTFFVNDEGRIEVTARFGAYLYHVPVDLDCAVAIAAGLAQIASRSAGRGRRASFTVQVSA